MSLRLLRAAVALAVATAGFVPLGLLALRAGGWDRLAGEGPALVGTLALVAGTVALAVAVGVPLGLALARLRIPAALATAAALPYAVPPYVTTLAWIRVANPTTGWFAPHLDIYGLGGMIWVLGLHLSPVVALAVRDAAGRIDPALEEAARMCGASPARVLRDVTLPLLLPAVLGSAGFVASAAAASFGVPYLLSAPAERPVPTLTTRIYQLLDVGGEDGRALAVSLSLLLLAVGLLIPEAIRRAIGGRGFASRRPVGRHLPRPSTAGGVLVGAWVALAAGLPLVVIVLTSLQRSTGGGLGPDNLGFDTWAAVLGDRRVAEALVRSVGLAAVTATVTVLAGGLLAHAAEREGTRAARAFAAIARAPYAVPGTALALGFLLAFSQEIRVVILERVTLVFLLADTVWLLGLAYVVKLLALPVDGVRAAVRGLDPALEEAARMAGASPGRALRDVTVPLLGPALGTAWFLVFVPAFCEVTLSVLLYGPRTEVLGTVLFYLQSYRDPQSAAVLAVLVVAVLGVGLAAGRLGRRAT